MFHGSIPVTAFAEPNTHTLDRTCCRCVHKQVAASFSTVTQTFTLPWSLGHFQPT